MIAVIGLGAERGDLSLKAAAFLRKADDVLVRTKHIPSVQTLDDEGISYTTLDFLYENSRTYDTFVKKVVAEVLRRGKEGTVCYCVDGSAEEDAAARLLLKRGAELFDGRAKASYFASLAGIGGDYTAVSAFDLSESELSLPLVVYDLTQDNLSDAKLFLAERFGDEAPAAYLSEGKAERIPLYEADRRKCGTSDGLVLFSQPLPDKTRYSFDDFVAVMRRLRAPDGCPWDRAQTHESIRINAIEEAYELVDAIDREDIDAIREEAGDVLMQSVFHTLMEEEKGNFTVSDMLTELCGKLITRHTHIFGGDRAADAESALAVWDRNKMKEKHQTTFSDAVNAVPDVFPALLRAQKIAKRMEKGGWDKATIENFEKKFREEYSEFKEAFAAKDHARTMEELGDVLFCTVELGRAAGVDCEMALLDTVKKCAARYTAYEKMVLADGKDVNTLTDEEKDAYYKRAKNAETA